MNKNKLSISALTLLLTTSACQSAQTLDSGTSQFITSHHLPELSGLTSSTAHPGELWAINDSGNGAKLYRLDTDLNVVQVVRIKAKNRDWEDLTSYTDERYTWIIIAETGDNKKKNKSSKLHFFREDKLLSATKKRIYPDRTLDFSFPKGPQNIEAVAIDPSIKEVVLISKKKEKAPIAYTLKLNDNNQQVAKKSAKLKHLLNTSKLSTLAAKLTSHNLDAVTALDISMDGTKAVVLTYTDVWLYQREPTQSWDEAFKLSPEHLGRHGLQQAEAICFNLDNSKILVTSEKLPTPLLVINTPN